ncbi:MAG: putative bifunctional diguanylate cyclase/phosphodiesterase [Tumebacillaceae bacterium]
MRKIPPIVWVICLATFIFPGVIEDGLNLDIKEMVWFLNILPSFFFAYYLGLRGGIITAFLSAGIHGLWEAGEFLNGNFHANDMELFAEVSIVRTVFAIGIGLLTDRLNRKQAENHELMFKDSLTYLYNRRYFQLKLQEEVDRHHIADLMLQNKKLVVMFLDVDRFKNINDTLGHSVGDKLLQAVAERLGGCIRPQDTVSRIGGDEFTVILPNIQDMREVEQIAQQIITTLAKPYELEQTEFFITASAGLSVYPDDGNDGETLIKNADTAMYTAKERGKNKYIFYSSCMHELAYERLRLDGDLRKALEREEFLVYYQPQVDLQTGRIIGMEALVRWRHPELGLVSPAMFIPLVEENGLIVPIGEWVLRTACRQSKAWQEAGYPPVRLAVNLSAGQFQHYKLTSMIRDVLEETGLDAEWLELEITESTVMKYVEETIATLHELKDMGLKISIDDFGTGYSSLSYLKRFPIDTLKIDQSFVRDISVDGDAAAIAKAVITLGHSLNLEVIAEGVETEEQFGFLKLEHCKAMQGYLFSPPVPADKFEKLLALTTNAVKQQEELA